VGLGLLSVDQKVRRRAIGGAYPEHAFLSSELPHPLAIARKIAVAGMTQAAGMRVHQAQEGQAPVILAENSARQRLSAGIELDVGHAGAALCPSRQRGQDNRLFGFPMPQQKPTGFLVAPRPFAVRRVLMKQIAGHLVG
jgi:hypothetical protein